jgi:dipeptidyl aminopeptidase/acylaminoacyl peptidase
MTQFAVGHTNRFYAAVADRGATNWVTVHATAFVGWHLESEFGGHYWENPESYKHFSPINYADKIRTPLLIMAEDNDLSCAIDQPLQMYTALKLMGKCPVELWRFPEEGHNMSRGGRPDRRMIRLEGIAEWFKKWLK